MSLFLVTVTPDRCVLLSPDQLLDLSLTGPYSHSDTKLYNYTPVFQASRPSGCYDDPIFCLIVKVSGVTYPWL